MTKVTSSKVVLRYAAHNELPHEEFGSFIWIIQMKFCPKSWLSKGGITGTLVDVRIVFKSTLEMGATS
jgi:DNA repair protein RadC